MLMRSKIPNVVDCVRENSSLCNKGIRVHRKYFVNERKLQALRREFRRAQDLGHASKANELSLTGRSNSGSEDAFRNNDHFLKATLGKDAKLFDMLPLAYVAHVGDSIAILRFFWKMLKEF